MLNLPQLTFGLSGAKDRGKLERQARHKAREGEERKEPHPTPRHTKSRQMIADRHRKSMLFIYIL